jgi:hypothetical protein
MRQRVLVSASAVALVALVAGGAALALRDKSSHTPRTITVQGGVQGAAASQAKLSADTASGIARPYQNMHFVLSGDLSPLDGDRPAWHLAASPTADLGTIAALAKTLGVAGDVKTVDGGWQVGDSQGAGPNLFVAKQPGLPWNFSNAGDMKVGYACASAGSASGGDLSTTTPPPPPDCTGPPPPAGVPTKDGALAKVGDLLKALGIDAGSFTLTANASEWSADVQAVPSIGGVAAPGLTTSFGFAGEGKLQYANGYLLAPEKADTYPRIGTTKAFDALKSGKGIMGWFGYGGPMMRNAVGVGVAGPATTAMAVNDSGSGSATVCAVDAPLNPTVGTTPPDAPATTLPVCSAPPVACMVPTPPPTVAGGKAIASSYPSCGPTECTGVAVTTILETVPPGDTTAVAPSCPVPMPEPTTPPAPVTITITGVHETLVPLMGADGSMWLVPGYEFTSTDGGVWPTLAIDQSFVDQVAPNKPVPQPAVAVGTAPAGGPAPEPAVTPTTAAAGG